MHNSLAYIGTSYWLQLHLKSIWLQNGCPFIAVNGSCLLFLFVSSLHLQSTADSIYNRWLAVSFDNFDCHRSIREEKNIVRLMFSVM